MLALAVGLSGAALAVGSYFVVRHNLLADSVDSGVQQTRADLELAPSVYPQASGLLTTRSSAAACSRRSSGAAGAVSSFEVGGLRQVPEGLQRVVQRGELGHERTAIGDRHSLVAGSPARGDAQLYFFFPEQGLHDELAQLRDILAAGVGILVLLAALAGALLARGVLRPVARASTAARSIAEGLLETRLPVEGRDEFGAWAQSFNEMAAALETKIAALSAAQARERRFTADVAHELRTPLTALVGEASLLAEHLERMPVELPGRPSS